MVIFVLIIIRFDQILPHHYFTIYLPVNYIVKHVHKQSVVLFTKECYVTNDIYYRGIYKRHIWRSIIFPVMFFFPYKHLHTGKFIFNLVIQIQISIENSYISIHENIKSIYENSSPILGLFKKTSLGNINRR